MIRCVQIGTTIAQGELIAANASWTHGTIRADTGKLISGRLVPRIRECIEGVTPDSPSPRQMVAGNSKGTDE